MVAIYASIPYIREAIDVLDISTSCPLFTIADFGASHGLNSMRAMKMIIEYLREAKMVDDEQQQILVVHNDLPILMIGHLSSKFFPRTPHTTGRCFYCQYPVYGNLESTNFISERSLLYKCAQAVLSPEQLLNFTFSVYQRSYAECVDRDLFARCSIELIRADIVRIESPQYADFENGQVTLDEFARPIAKTIRSWSQSVLRQALEINGKPSTTDDIIMAQFWTIYEKNVKEWPQEFNTCVCLMFLTLKKANAMEIKYQ
ncbi:unnamed protein product [Rotaria socialis]|nr:unnamed protein product [Rotaria socialis]